MTTKLPDAVNAGDEIEVQLAPRGAYPQIVDGKEVVQLVDDAAVKSLIDNFNAEKAAAAFASASGKMIEYAPMNFIEKISAILKGAAHAKRTEDTVSRGRVAERRVVHPLASVREQALSDLRRIRVLARACADERGRASRQMPSDPIRETGLALINAARAD